ncbi:DoxX family protein, partial [bacterium]|nr:DoxX family protein [bacterium]
MKKLTQTARILTGLLFVFSGFVKGIDPMGTAFKLTDYFTAFNIGFLDGMAVPLSITLCLVEFITGMMLLSGSLVTLASWSAALFMALFTPLTLVLAIFNPVSDCGCFGDAIQLTNWQT